MVSETTDRTVLVVDDDPDHLRLTVRTVRSLLPEGTRVHEAKTRDDARRQLDSTRFDLVLCDLRLGPGDGIETLQRAREMQPSALRVLYTAHADVDVAIRAIDRARVHGFLLKTDYGEFRGKLDELLRRRAFL